MDSAEYRIHSLDELPEVAGAFVARFPEGGIFLLRGEMGAGKTTFVRAVCEQLGAMGASSPTFALVNEYQAPAGLRIVHMDLYRLRSAEEVFDIGLTEYLGRPGYVFIEWPDLALPILRGEGHEVRIAESLPSGERTIAF